MRRVKILALIGIIVALFSLLFFPIYFTRDNDAGDTEPGNQENVVYSNLFDCFPENQYVTKEDCVNRGCIYDTNLDPICIYSDQFGYKVYKNISDDAILLQVKPATNIYEKSDLKKYEFLEVRKSIVSSKSVRFTIQPNEDNTRWQVPFDHPTLELDVKNPEIEIGFVQPFGVIIKDIINDAIIFESSIGPLIFEEMFMQINTAIPLNYDLYGMGEKDKATFRYDLDIRHRMTIWSVGQNVKENANLYGHQTFLLGIGEAGRSYGIWMLNSNAMEVELNKNTLTYRPIGGILDFYVFVDASPNGVLQQYHSLVGLPFFPPYWGYGFQLSRWGYIDLNEVEDTVDRNLAHNIPYETQYIDIEYMDRALDFTIGENFSNLPIFTTEKLHDNDMRLVLIFDPAICSEPYEDPDKPYSALSEGIRRDVFIKRDNEILYGAVWPAKEGIDINTGQPYLPKSCPVAFPDFHLTSTIEWWTAELKNYHARVPYDAIWIDMNEPSNFMDGSYTGCGDSKLENPPFVPSMNCECGDMVNKTICMSSVQYPSGDVNGVGVYHYDTHSLYGHSMSAATAFAANEIYGSKRSWVVTRSNFGGSGRYAGHWLGDNHSTWRDLANSIVGMLDMNLFGIPYTGADICGFSGEADEELCTRWMQLGAFYPFSRNHNAKYEPEQDPGSTRFSDVLRESAAAAMNIRYSFLPELHNLFYQSSINGGTVVRSLAEQ